MLRKEHRGRQTDQASAGEQDWNVFYNVTRHGATSSRWNHIIATVTRLTLIFVAVCAISTAANAQWLRHPTPGIPRTADGKPDLTAPAPRAADGKPDLSGLWQPAADRYYNNIRAGLDSKDVQPWANAVMQKRVREFGKDSMETLCLPLGPAVVTTIV